MLQHTRTATAALFSLYSNALATQLRALAMISTKAVKHLQRQHLQINSL